MSPHPAPGAAAPGSWRLARRSATLLAAAITSGHLGAAFETAPRTVTARIVSGTLELLAR